MLKRPLYENGFIVIFDHRCQRLAGYTIRNDKYKFIHLDQNGERLYRIDTDPGESTNLLNRTLSTEDQENLNQLRATAETLRASEP